MLNEERKRKILEITNERRSVSLNELMKLLDASQSTIRRDLNELHQSKLLKKVHGGAVSLTNILTQDETVLQRQDLNRESKTVIARYAASLVKDSDVVYIDAGTTTGEMLQYLTSVHAVYITNCISHAQILADFGHQVYVTSGVLKTKTEALVGSDTYKYIENMNFTIGFFGSNGISIEEGFTTPDPQEGEINASPTAIATKSISSPMLASSTSSAPIALRRSIRVSSLPIPKHQRNTRICTIP